MKVLLDTNIVLDLLLEREPYYKDAKEIFLLAEKKFFKAYLSASSITTIHYLSAKELGKKEADNIITILLKIFDITALNKDVFILALNDNGVDFEDSVIYSSAYKSKIDYIITRDIKGYKNSKVKVLQPLQFLEII